MIKYSLLYLILWSNLVDYQPFGRKMVEMGNMVGIGKRLKPLKNKGEIWWRGKDLNLRPSGYEPDELPDCSTPR